MIPTADGTYNAFAANIGIDETGSNNLTTAVIEFKLYEELAAEGAVDVTELNFSITGYFYIEKKDGSINTITVDQLKDAFGWDGRDPFWLQDTDLSQKAVQLVLANEEWNGKVRMKVKYLNPFGFSGGQVSKAGGAKRQAITNRLGPRLRAVSGGVAAPAKMPAGKPTMPAPAKPAAPAARKAAAPVATATMDEAWAEFVTHCVDKDGNPMSQDLTEAEWFGVLERLFPGKSIEQLKPADWHAVKATGQEYITPF